MRNGQLDLAVANVQIMRGITLPNLNIEWSGARDLSVVLLTDCNLTLFMVSVNGKSNIIQNSLDL